jgi:hypothetical protein
MSFAGTISTFAPNTLKISVAIQNWPFLALTNSLAIIFDAGASANSQNSKLCLNAQASGNSGSLQWLLASIGDVSWYHFLRYFYLLLSFLFFSCREFI